MITASAALVLLAAAKCSAEGTWAIRGSRHLDGAGGCVANPITESNDFTATDSTSKCGFDSGAGAAADAFVAGDTHFFLQVQQNQLKWAVLTPTPTASGQLSCADFHCRATAGGASQVFPMYPFGTGKPSACICDFYGFDNDLDTGAFTIDFLLPSMYSSAKFSVESDSVITKQRLEQRLFNLHIDQQLITGTGTEVRISSQFQRSQDNPDCAVKEFEMTIDCAKTDDIVKDVKVGSGDSVFTTNIDLNDIEECLESIASSSGHTVYDVQVTVHSVTTKDNTKCDRDSNKKDIGSKNEKSGDSVQGIFKPALVDAATNDADDVATHSFQITIDQSGKASIQVAQVAPSLGAVVPAKGGCGENFEPMAKLVVPLIVSLSSSQLGEKTTLGQMKFIGMKMGDRGLVYESGCQAYLSADSWCQPNACDDEGCTIRFTLTDCQAQQVVTEDVNGKPDTCTFEDVAKVQGSVVYKFPNSQGGVVEETALIEEWNPSQEPDACGAVAETVDVTGNFDVTTTVTENSLSAETAIEVVLDHFASSASQVTFVIDKVVITATHPAPPGGNAQLTLTNGAKVDHVVTALTVGAHNEYAGNLNSMYSTVTWCRKQNGKKDDGVQDNACTYPAGENKCPTRLDEDKLFLTLSELYSFGKIVDTQVEVKFDLTLRLTNCPGAANPGGRRLETDNVPQLIHTTKTVVMEAGTCELHKNRASCNSDALILGGCMWTKLAGSKRKCYPRPAIFNVVETACDAIKDTKICLARQDCFQPSKGNCARVDKCEQYETKGLCKQDLANVGRCKPKMKAGKFVKCRTRGK